jgi:cytochrome P450
VRFTLLYDVPFFFNSRYTIVHAVLKEILRLYPSAPLVGRTSRDDPLIIPSTTNLYLPPKTQIMMTSLLTHKRADLWGPDAEVFRPERWFEPALLDKVARTPFMYSPFYGGPRAVSTPHPASSLSSIDGLKKKI